MIENNFPIWFSWLSNQSQQHFFLAQMKKMFWHVAWQKRSVALEKWSDGQLDEKTCHSILAEKWSLLAVGNPFVVFPLGSIRAEFFNVLDFQLHFWLQQEHELGYLHVHTYFIRRFLSIIRLNCSIIKRKKTYFLVIVGRKLSWCGCIQDETKHSSWLTINREKNWHHLNEIWVSLATLLY